MPTREIITLLTFLFLPASGGNEPQARNGFMGYAWGTTLEQVQKSLQLELIDSYGGYTRYAAEIQSLDGIELDDCHFEFYQNQFSGVVLTTRGHTRSQKLLVYLQQRFGTAHDQHPIGCQWFTGNVHVSFDEDSAGDGYVYWYSVSLHQRADRQRR